MNSTSNLDTSFWGGLFLAIICGTIGISLILIVPSLHSNYTELVNSSAPLIVSDRGINIIYGGWSLFFLMVFLGLYSSFTHLKPRKNKGSHLKTLKITGYIAIVAVALTIIGFHLGQKFWSDYFSSHNYHRCSAPFVMTGNWAKEVWVESPSFCSNSSIIEFLRSRRHDLSDVSQYRSSSKIKEGYRDESPSTPATIK